MANSGFIVKQICYGGMSLFAEYNARDGKAVNVEFLPRSPG